MKKEKSNGDFVYSTNPDFSFDREEDAEELNNAGQQHFLIYPDRRNRNGKTVTVISGFNGGLINLKQLEKDLKSLCGTGGTVKDGDILLQGNFIEKVKVFLEKNGHKTKISGI